MNIATIYCKFTEYFWSASTGLDGSTLGTVNRTHGSARQAADEVLELIRRKTGRTDLTLQRRTAKVYDVVTPQEQALRVEPINPFAPKEQAARVDPNHPWKASWCDSITCDVDSRVRLIKSSTDTEWLKRVVALKDNQKTVQQAAERRLRKLTRVGTHSTASPSLPTNRDGVETVPTTFADL